MPSLQELTDELRHPSVAELSLVARAYEFADKRHASHRRYSGEPYFTHLFETAKILAELGMRGETVAAGLLHDSIEDAGVNPKEITEQFGRPILALVEGVTELGRLHYRGTDRYVESLRRFFMASAKDIRVIIIKLADRLHNVRTLRFVPKEKQYRIAKETLEIYAPLAYRLGIRKINRELEELAFPHVYPEDYSRVKALLKKKHRELAKSLGRFRRSLLKGLAKREINTVSTDHRIKGLYSLYLKLKKLNWDIEGVYDILALRVIVPTVEDCYRTLGVIHSVWRPLPGRIKDYIAFPKPNGYRSLHTTVFTGDGAVVEIQIRTEEMHRESEYGVALHFEYKELEKREGRTSASLFWTVSWMKRLFSALSLSGESASDGAERAAGNGSPAWVRELGAHSQDSEPEFWKHLTDDFFKNRVFTLTPKGDVVDLPADSSPVDFAYAIHSDIGDHLHGVQVNGKLVAIDTPLKNGDIVRILTREQSHPSPKWLEITRTALAKKHIRNALQKHAEKTAAKKQ